MPCCSGPTLLSLWPVLVGGSASCLAVLSTLHSLVRRWLCVWRTGRGLPGLAISVACGDRPVRWLVCAAALRDSSSAPDASLEHNRRFLFPPTPANSPPKKIRCPHWHSAASLHRSAPPSPAAEAAGHCRWFPALRTVPQSSDLHSPPACPCSPARTRPARAEIDCPHRSAKVSSVPICAAAPAAQEFLALAAPAAPSLRGPLPFPPLRWDPPRRTASAIGDCPAVCALVSLAMLARCPGDCAMRWPQCASSRWPRAPTAPAR